MHKYKLLLLFLVTGIASFAQNTFIPFSQESHHSFDRAEILSGEMSPHLHLTTHQLRKTRVSLFINQLKEGGNLNYINGYDVRQLTLKVDTVKGKFLKHFYKNPYDFFSVNKKGFKLRVNPVFYGKVGRDTDVGTVYQNTRGIVVEGEIDDKVSFYTMLTDNQAILPGYVESQLARYEALPGQNFWKRYKDGEGVDYLFAKGYIAFNLTKHIDLQFGTDRNFIGNGYRSLILSDYAGNYPYLKLNTQVWKIQYTNIFAQLIDSPRISGGVPADGLYPKKYLAMHRAGINIGKNLNVGLFESVIFSRKDSLGNGSFDLSYLNPIIFYRSAEQNNGSHDNALIGLDFKWNFFNRFQLYGQFVLDELIVKEFTSGNGWWANKQSFQLGGKYINAFGIDNLDLQGEVNYIRPYMYSHGSEANYSHFNQSLAHPIGANLVELLAIARYQPNQKLSVVGKLMYIKTGLDTLNSNYGGNILLDNRTHPNDYGNTVAQGVDANILYADLRISYMLKPNLWIDLQQVFRSQSSSVGIYDTNTSYSSLGIRWNISPMNYEF